ncbi:hypothetical protein CDD83_8998 [Cordyceps sp. RAO-2017]|nr:hypothetical protein CDD83_8998 [Cordyceps sp. RAO-2017]
MDNTSRCDDDDFGPFIHGCRGDFDFTLLFEQSFFSITPSSLFLLLSTLRLGLLLSRGRRQVSGTWFQLGKLAAIACYGAVQSALLALWARTGVYETRTSLAAAVLSFADVFALGLLSWFEHAYSPRPSALINIYLLLSIVFDAVQARTLWLKHAGDALPALFTASLAIKAALLALESIDKDSFLPPAWRARSPEERSGVFSRGLLLWLHRILFQGRKHTLHPQDLYTLVPGLETRRLSSAFWEAWSSQAAEPSSKNIGRALLHTLKWSLLAPVIPRLAQCAFTICQPLLLGEFLRYLQGEDNFVSGTGYGFIGAYGLLYCGLAISTCLSWRLTYKCLIKMRGCLVAAIYKKTTDIDAASCDMTAPVALMSTDMERIIHGCKDFHEIWGNTLQVAVSVWLLYNNMGIACVAPSVVTILSSAGSFVISSYADKAQERWMEATQARVAATVKAITSMKFMRLLGLSDNIHAMLSDLRRAELRAAKVYRYIEVLTANLSFAPLLLSPVFTFMVFVIQAQSTGNRLDITTAFTSLSLLQLMTNPLVWLFQSIPLFVASLGCLRRIELYLNSQPRTEMRTLRADESGWTSPSASMSSAQEMVEKPNGVDGNAIAIRDGQFGWTRDSPVLREVNVDIPASKLTMIVGPVASGKSTFSKAIIGEIPYCTGQVHLNLSSAQIAYCDQNAFVINGTVRDNIVGFSDFDSIRYDAVVRAVDLAKDVAAMADGHQTRVGSKGVILSGGQRQRVAIARAVYARTALAVFDDVLSGLDAVTKRHVFEHVFSPRGLLREQGCTVMLSTHDVDLLPEADHIIALGRDGCVADSGSYAHLSQESEYIKSLAVREVQAANHDGAHQANSAPARLSMEGEEPPAEAPEDMKRRLGDASIYRYLFHHIGLRRVLLFCFYECGWAVFSTIGPVWLKFWAAASMAGEDRDGYYMGVFVAFQGLALVFLALIASHTLVTVAVRAGKSLHGVLLRTVMAAPMSFFGTVDAGITTNRFSQDLILIDGDLPISILETVSAGLVALVQAILIAIAAPYVAIAYPFLVLLLYAIQSFYLRTSRQLRFLELEAKSPLYTHFLETLQGLATIRSFGWSDENNELNHQLVDASQKPLYLLYMVQRWLQLVLELLIAVTAVILIAVAVQLHSTSAGFIGVALVNLMSISQELKMIVIEWTNLETSLSALARTKSFEEETPPEGKEDGRSEPPSAWPQTGHVQLSSISASYGVSEQASLALRDVSMTIPNGRKVAICGRSGSGKSTLVMALARMIDLTSGSITVDGVDLSSLPRSTVRSALNVIPQEPHFFHKTTSQNLDPSGSASAEAMRSALEKVQLWEVVDLAGGLDAELDVETLSQGQRQLLALARALLRQGKIVVLDEATSNVDKHVEEVMQQIIREEFQGRTIIAVAHQLRTIIDFDEVMVMDAGQLVESGTPRELMARDSTFKRLCDMQGVSID